MSQLGSFFKGSDTRLGVFYPEKYIVASFSSLGRAHEAAAKLRCAGFSDDEVIAVSGQDLVKLMEEERSPVSVVMTGLSRFFDTEAHYADRDVKDAEQGGAIVAVHCPDDPTKKAAWEAIAPIEPTRARYYALSGVEHLAGES